MLPFRAFLAVCCCTLSAAAVAEKLAVINVQQALFDSEAAIEFNRQLQEQLNSDQQRILRLEGEAQRLRGKIESLNQTLEEAQRRQLDLQFRKVFEQYQQASERLRQARKEKEKEFLATMRPKLDNVIRGLIKQRDIDVVIRRKDTVYAKPELDLTELVTQGLNRQP